MAARAAGISYRQLDYWARTELVEPTVRGAAGSGSQRLYGFRDILVLKSSSGCSTPASRCSRSASRSPQLREAGIEDLGDDAMSDGASVYLCTSDDEVIDLVNRGQGVFGIAVGKEVREVESRSNSTRSPPTTSSPARRGSTRKIS